MSKPTPTRPYIVRSSTIHGRGVFARRAIRKGARIIEYRGKRRSAEEAEDLPASDPRDPSHTFLFETSDGTIIDAATRGNAARWINHACQPNCQALEETDGRVCIYARRSIAQGEELTYDYRLRIDGRITRALRKQYECRCGSPRCRGTMLRLVVKRTAGKSPATAAGRKSGPGKAAPKKS